MAAEQLVFEFMKEEKANTVSVPFKGLFTLPLPQTNQEWIRQGFTYYGPGLLEGNTSDIGTDME